MRTDQSRLRRPGIAAAVAVLAAAGVVGGVSVAGARRTSTIYAVENGLEPCFSASAQDACATGEQPSVTIQTGDTVMWELSSRRAQRVLEGLDARERAVGHAQVSVVVPSAINSGRSARPASYRFVCQCTRRR